MKPNSFTLSQLVKPSVGLVPMLLAKDNILFLDALGRPPRVLPYEFFRSFKVIKIRPEKMYLIETSQVVQEFIKHDFRDVLGNVVVRIGKYVLSELDNP